MMLSIPNVTRLTGASRRQLNYWEKTGLLRPSGKATGRRLYTFPDVVAVKTVAALRKQGCSLQQVRKAVKYLRKHYPVEDHADVLSRLTLLTDGEAVYLLSDADQIMEVVSRQTVLWVVNVGRLILDTRRQAESLPIEWTEIVTVRNERYRLRVSHDTEDGGFVAQCLELPGAIEQGETAAEAVANGKAAIASVLAYLAKRAARHTPARTTRRVRSA
jgi:DNA-binding transcriptional MerR regulator